MAQHEDRRDMLIQPIVNPSTVDASEIPQPLTPDELRAHKEAEARSERQGEWSNVWYMSVTGLRCRFCLCSFEDNDHQFFCGSPGAT